MLFGLAPSWSFEQGTFAVVAAVVSLTAWCVMRSSKRHALLAPAAFVALLLPTTWLGFHLLSGGHGQETLRFAFHTVPENQGWYFGVPPNPSLAVMTPAIGEAGLPSELLRKLATVVLAVYLLAVLLLFAGLATAIILRRRINAAPRLLLGLGFLACLALFSGSSLSGMLAPSYLIPAVDSVIIAGIGIVYLSIRGRPRALVASAATVIAISFGALVLAYTNEMGSLYAVRVAKADPEISGVHPLGVYQSMFPLIERVHSVPNATVFSTFRGMLDISTNQSPHGRVDYIIHAFDDEEHKRFLETFALGNFSFVHTLRPTFTIGEEWLQTKHWDFYHPLVERYAVVGESEFSLLWQQRPEPLLLQLRKCRRLTPDGQGRWQTPTASSPVFLQLTADYESHNALDSIPIIGKLPRYLLEHQGLANRLPVSLNPSHRSATWMVRSIANAPGWVVPRLYSPLPGATLTVTKIAACEIVMPADVNPAFAHLLFGPDQR
jgi:hypothetical protein